MVHIPTHQSNYEKSIQRIEPALITNKSMKYKQDVGAIIN